SRRRSVPRSSTRETRTNDVNSAGGISAIIPATGLFRQRTAKVGFCGRIAQSRTQRWRHNRSVFRKAKTRSRGSREQIVISCSLPPKVGERCNSCHFLISSPTGEWSPAFKETNDDDNWEGCC